MLRKVITLIILSSATLLSSCAKTIFDNEARCPFVDKGGCQSMEMVNKMVTERRFTPDGAFVQHFKEGSSNKNYSSNKNKVSRTPKIAHMWVSPCQDKEGGLHQESYVDFAVKKSDSKKETA